MKRMRGRTHRSSSSGGGGGGGSSPRQYGGNIPLNRNHVFDSSGPDLRVRGTAQQLFEKYLQLGRDATGSGDRVMAESYFQYAEHYFRILNAINQATQQQGQQQAGQQQPGQQAGQAPQQAGGGYQQNGQYAGGSTPPPNGHAGGQYNGQRREREEEGEQPSGPGYNDQQDDPALAEEGAH